MTGVLRFMSIYGWNNTLNSFHHGNFFTFCMKYIIIRQSIIINYKVVQIPHQLKMLTFYYQEKFSIDKKSPNISNKERFRGI